jgi:transposase
MPLGPGMSWPTKDMTPTHCDDPCVKTALCLLFLAGRKRTIIYDKSRYHDRHLIENAFGRLKDFRRVATRYDKLAANFLSAVALATLVVFWL